MTQLHKILSDVQSMEYATSAGKKMHAQLQCIIIDSDIEQGDVTLIQKIKQHPEIVPFFADNAKTEVPIAGTINGKFISRRIDRLQINHTTKHIDVLDYKTDINHNAFLSVYIAQLHEYVQLLKHLYPDYTANAYILWTHDFSLEKII